MTERRFQQLDVFTRHAMLGNPLAVVLDAQDLDDARMQAFARWTNLSETTFLLPPSEPGADYRVRIFTPGGELPFAGHPTLGSCRAWLSAGGRPLRAGEVVQQCGVGLVRIRIDGDTLAFAAPPLRESAPSETERRDAAVALGIAPGAIVSARWLDNGPRWLALRLAHAQQVLDLEPDHTRLARLAKVGVVGPWPAGTHEADIEVRAFAAPIGVPEDPVTGSLNAGLASWLMAEGVIGPRYIAAQGTRLGRRGRVHVRSDGDTLWIGGEVAPCIEGIVRL